MSITRQFFTVLALGLLIGCATSAAASTAGGAPVGPVKPVIGTPVTVPEKPLAGKRFSVSFKVIRSDNGAALTGGKMICDPSVAGTVIRHAESFAGGTARLSFVIPVKAAGKLLKVKVTIKTGGQSATKVATFHVQASAVSTLSIGDVSATEGNTGTATLSFPVTLSPAAGQTVLVSYATADGTASAPSDYRAGKGTLTFKAGDTRKAITVEVMSDQNIEENETFTVRLSNPVKATLSDGSATGTIETDDAPRSGHYAGTTSQGLPIAFDVIASARGVTNLEFSYVAFCPSGPWPPRQTRYSADILVRPDGSFSLTDDFMSTDRMRRVVFSFTGRLSVPGSASGGLSFVFEFFDQSGSMTLRCATGEVTWNAS